MYIHKEKGIGLSYFHSPSLYSLPLLKKKKRKEKSLSSADQYPPSIKRFLMEAGTERATTCVQSTLPRLAPLSRFLERIVNIITVRRTDNLDRCKTTNHSSSRCAAFYIYAYYTPAGRVHVDNDDVRLVSEPLTRRFVLQNRPRPGSHANGAVNPRGRMLISNGRGSLRGFPTSRGPQILLRADHARMSQF